MVALVRLKYGVDGKWLESRIELKCISSFQSFNNLEDEALQVYLDDKAVDSKDLATIQTLEKLFEKHRCTHMTDEDASSRMKTLFISYKTHFR